jgi:outer membrane lipoprotein-sorting protein
MNLFFGHVIVGLVFVVSSFGIAVFSAEDSAPDLTTDSTTAKHIITQVADVYKTCKSYFDSGVVKTIFFMKDGKHVDEKPFTTAFVRPDRFRFECSSKFPIPGAKPMRYIVWAKGKDVRSWWDVQPGIKKEVSLEMALAAATGVSGGSAHTIPVLLMPKEIGGWSVTELHQLNRIADSLLDNVECYRIQGKRKVSDSELITLWISKKTFLIHRIDSTHKFPEFRTETTTTYKPKVDVVIDESKLTFNAPEKGSN